MLKPRSVNNPDVKAPPDSYKIMATALISALAMGQSMLVAHLLARRISNSNVYIPLALFFAVNAIAQLCFIVREPDVSGADIAFLPELTLFKLLIELALPALLWIYVRELTSSNAGGWRKTDLLHIAAPVIPSILIAIFACALASRTVDVDLNFFIGKLNGILNITALIQFCVYVIFVMRRLAGYRRRLMDFFASTTDMELRWFRIALLLILVGISLELCAEVLYAVYAIDNPFVPWNGLVRLALVWFFAAWGLRQTPDLRIEIAKTNEHVDAVKKYQKSSLSANQISDVAQKIRTKVETNKGYKDPNLSLRTLSKQIDVLPNYASQALNMEIKENFFDYVNKLRVADAMHQLTTSDDTVLTISTEVGFNSRSSFYTAFKKVTGKTPISYRKEHSDL